MPKLICLLLVLFITSQFSYAQDFIDVTDQTIKVGGLQEEKLMYGFAAGDKILFSFQEVNNKELKEIEIIEYPSNSKFSDYKSKKTEKSFTATKQGVYVFRFMNSALGGRVCKIKIQRAPASKATETFNTDVKWVTQYDTSWNSYTKDVITGYDTIRTAITKKQLVKTDTIFTPLFDKTLWVYSQTNSNSSYTYADVELPSNKTDNPLNPYKSTELIAWSYWIGVGQQSIEEYHQVNKNMSAGIRALGIVTGYGALANLVATGISLFRSTSSDNNVQYKFYGYQNNQQIIIDYGNVTAASGRNEKIKQGSFRIELYNDNKIEGISVNVKMLAMQVSRTWKDIPYIQVAVRPRYEKKIFKDPVITFRTVAVTGL